MLQFAITNIMCGNCMLKIKKELEKYNINVVRYDISYGTFLVNAQEVDYSRLQGILDHIDYNIDKESVTEIQDFHIWDDKLDDEDVFNEFTNFLSTIDGEIIDFDTDDMALIYRTNSRTYLQILDYIKAL